MAQSTPLDAYLSGIAESHGLRRATRRVLVIEREGNLGLLSFTRAGYSSDGWTDITPHLAVESARLAAARGEAVRVRPPQLGGQPWYRSGMHIHEDIGTSQWGPLSETDASTWSVAGDDLDRRVLPALLEHITDAGLRDCWLAHDDPMTYRLNQQSMLTLLAREIGPQAVFEAAIADLRVLLRTFDPAVHSVAEPYVRALGILPHDGP